MQRDGEKDPTDLTGTPFEKFDGKLQKVLKDKAVFPWSKPTLAETLGEMSNGSVATLARIGAMISATAPFLWDYVKRIGGGGWITDNFGVGIDWTDGAGLGDRLTADPNFCKDNPATAKHYHGTTSAFRQISRQPGTPSMHVITAGKTGFTPTSTSRLRARRSRGCGRASATMTCQRGGITLAMS